MAPVTAELGRAEAEHRGGHVAEEVRDQDADEGADTARHGAAAGGGAERGGPAGRAPRARPQGPEIAMPPAGEELGHGRAVVPGEHHDQLQIRCR